MVRGFISKLIFGADVKEHTIPNGEIIHFEKRKRGERPSVDLDSVDEIELEFDDSYRREPPLDPQRVRSIANTFFIYVEEGKTREEIWKALEKKSYSLGEIRAGYDIFKRSA